jgi:hypothetical protein
MNYNHAVGVFKDSLIKALLDDDPIKIEEQVSEILNLLLKKPIPIRNGRSYPINKNPRSL